MLFNWGVQGDLRYRIGDSSIGINSNEIVVLNGAAEKISVKGLVKATKADAVDIEWGFASLPHGVEGHGFTNRNRLLVFADGVETTVTQIAV